MSPPTDWKKVGPPFRHHAVPGTTTACGSTQYAKIQNQALNTPQPKSPSGKTTYPCDPNLRASVPRPPTNRRQPNRRIILSIFAGRQCYLEILFRYLDYLLDQRVLSEIHIWDYCKTPTDTHYISEACKSKPLYRLFTPRNRSAWQWIDYYSYYANDRLNPSDVLIKCDDDMVFIDIHRINAFLDRIREDCLYFPNIVNNDVCAFLQSNMNIHNLLPTVDRRRLYHGCTKPLSNWSRDPDSAVAIHRHFLSNVSRYAYDGGEIPWASRISINFFAATYTTIKRYYSAYLSHINHKMKDEPYLTGAFCEHFHTSNLIVPFFNVVHFSFKNQKPGQLRDQFLSRYRTLARELTKKSNDSDIKSPDVRVGETSASPMVK